MRGTAMRGATLIAIMLVAYACTRRPVVKPIAPRPVPIATATPRPPDREVAAVVAAIGPIVRARLAPFFAWAGVAYPPHELALLAFKQERRLEIWARDTPDAGPVPWRRIDARAILAASGGAGPKLFQGDLQVPEGLYQLIAFNPHSRFHLSMLVDYPNAFDLEHAQADGRTELGGEIFVHGGARSIGCLAIGDRGIEDLFVLVADVGLEQTEVVIAPRDPRGGIPLAAVPRIPFTAELYRRIEERVAEFSPPPELPAVP